MQDLRLVGVHEDGEHLLLSDGSGDGYRLPLDEPLRAAALRDRPRLGQLQIEIEGGLRPRDVQAMIRTGMSADEVAHRSGWPLDKVRRYESPILAERAYVAARAQDVTLRTRGGGGVAATLASRVRQRLSGRGVDPTAASWDAGRGDDGQWTVTLTFPAGGRERIASWHFDPTARTVAARNDEARWLSEDDSGGGNPIPAPHLVTAHAGSAGVYDVEAEGGLRPSRSRDDHDGSPIDLMAAMREHSAAGRRRSAARRRTSPPARTSLDSSPRSDALPLDEMSYDPETMPPPPAAAGPHPADSRAPPTPTGLPTPGPPRLARPVPAPRSPTARMPPVLPEVLGRQHRRGASARWRRDGVVARASRAGTTSCSVRRAATERTQGVPLGWDTTDRNHATLKSCQAHQGTARLFAE